MLIEITASRQPQAKNNKFILRGLCADITFPPELFFPI